MFVYAVAQPSKHVLAEKAQRAQWSGEKKAREAEAAANGGGYGAPALVEIIYDNFAEQKIR